MGLRHSTAILNALGSVRNWMRGDVPEMEGSFLTDTRFLVGLMARQIVGWPACWALWITFWLHHAITLIVDAIMESDDELMRKRTREAVDEWRKKRAEIEKD